MKLSSLLIVPSSYLWIVAAVSSCRVVVGGSSSSIDVTPAKDDHHRHHHQHHHHATASVATATVATRNDMEDITTLRAGASSAVKKTTSRTIQDERRRLPSSKVDQRRGSTSKQDLIAGKGKGPNAKLVPATANVGNPKTKPSILPSLGEHKDALLGVAVLTMIERGISTIFVQRGMTFPAQLAGCIGLFVALLFADVIRPGGGESIYRRLLPGSNLLAKWFPVLFVPGLVMLPLAPSIGNGWEVAKFISVAVVGLVYSLLTTAYTVLFLRSVQSKRSLSTSATSTSPRRSSSTNPIQHAAQQLQQRIPHRKRGMASSASSPTTVATPPKAYRDETMTFLFRTAVASGIVSILATNAGNEFSQPVRTIFFFVTTFASYVWGARLPTSITTIIHPLIVSAMITLTVLQGTSLLTSESFVTVLKSYKVGTHITDWTRCGAADIMMFLLGPSVVSFAISMYNRRLLLKDNLIIVLLSMLVSSVGGLFGTAAFVRWIALGGKGGGGGMIRLSTLARNVTTALAIACTNVLQGDVSLAVLIVVMTGVLGATYGRTMLDALGIKDPITRGLAIGGSAQGLGVTSMMSEPDAFPFAAMSMILTAISATVLVSIPPIQQALVHLCQGNV